MLHDEGVPGSLVYDYSFACPNVACLVNPDDWNPGGAHGNIFNIGNVEDPVTYLPSNVVHAFAPKLGAGSTWGKFGKSYWFYPDSQNQSPAGHDMSHYTHSLSARPPLGSFYTIGVISVQVVMRVLGVYCPVDIEVYDDAGEMVARTENCQPVYGAGVPGDVLVAVKGDEKNVLLPAGGSYTVKLVGTGEGTMTYEAACADLASDQAAVGKAFKSVGLHAGKQMVAAVEEAGEEAETPLFVLGEPGEPVEEVAQDGAQSEHVHSWGEAVVTESAGCTTAGSTLTWCSSCGYGKAGEVAPTGHDWGEWEVVEPATATAAGSERRTCLNDPGHSETRSIPATGAQLPASGGGGAVVPPPAQDDDPDTAAAAAKVKAQKYKKGKAVKPSPKLTYKGKALKKGTDYTLRFKNNKKRGTATITVKGKGNFKGSKVVRFRIA